MIRQPSVLLFVRQVWIWRESGSDGKLSEQKPNINERPNEQAHGENLHRVAKREVLGHDDGNHGTEEKSETF